MRRFGNLPRFALVLLALLLAACGAGEDDESPTRGAFRKQADETAIRALSFLARGDLRSARQLFTPRGWQNFEENVDRMRAHFFDEHQGDLRKSNLEARLPAPLSPEAWRDLREAPPKQVWALYLKAYPLPDPGKLKGLRLDPNRPDDAQLMFQGPLAQERSIRLVRNGGLWSVSDVALP